MKTIKKRLLAVLLAAVTLLGVLPISALAAEVTMDLSRAEVSWDYTLKDEEGNAFSAVYGLNASDNPFGYSISEKHRSMHDYTAKRPGLGSDKSKWVYGRDYVYCFCVEHGVPLPNANEYAASSDPSFGDKYERLSSTQKDLLALALTYGYTGRTDVNSNKDANACYAATQLIIWQITLGFRTSATELHDKTYPGSGYTGTMTEQYCRNKYLKRYYDLILSDMANHYKHPSFTSALQNEAPTYEMNYENGKYSITLTDTNHVLQNFYVSSNGGVSTSINGNTLTISSSAPITNTANIKLNRIIPYTVDTTGFLIWSVPGKEGQNQDMVSGVPANNDPVPSYLKIQTAVGSAKIVKTSEDGEVEGIVFTIAGNGINQTVKTGAGGTVQIDNLRPGVYTVTEKGYDKYEPQESRQVTVVSGQTATVTFNNNLKRGNLTVTKTAEDGLSKGMKFHLFGTSLSGIKVDEYAVVGADGKARFQGVLIGSGYTLEEVDTPDRYIVPDSQKADIQWNEVTNKSFDNDLQRGNLTVTKTAEDGLTQGMRFHLYGTSYSGLPVDEYATVGADGKAYFRDILIGSGYTLEEVDAPARYVVPADQTADIEWNKVTNKSFDNVLKKWNLTVTKRDSETGSAQGDGTLAGAVYGIYKGEQLIDRYTTDANGQFTTRYYLCGDDWSLREITPSEGYLLDESAHHIGAEARHYTAEYNALSDTVKERNTKGRIAVIKHTDDGSTQIETPEVGAEFQVFLKSSGSYAAAKDTERDYLICDENGFAQTKLLPYGVYTVRQTKGWPGRELMKPFDVYISKNGQTYRYLINNSNFESYIKVIKTDSETGKAIPYAGAGFQIYDPNGQLVTMRFTYPEVVTIDTFYTNSEGFLITPEKLPYGSGYSIVEVAAPYGYILDSTPVYFDVTADNATEENAVVVVKVERPNTPQKGTITICKSGEVFSSVVESGELYQPVYAAQGLPGAVYEVTAAEDVVTPDGTRRVAKGTVVATIKTGSDGTAVTKPLYLGKYAMKEITAPYGMVVSDEIRSVELTYAGQEVEITETAASFYNERQKVEISLSKTLEKNERFGIGNNDEILAVQFGLFAAENLTAADGSAIPANGLLEIVSCNENSSAVFATDIPVGAKLYVQEISTDSHYIFSDKKYPVTFEYAGQEVATVDISVNDGEAIQNDLIYGTVKGLKIDRETGETIAGAVFGLFRADETEYTTETAILTAQSQEDGIFLFLHVPYGKWIVRELRPAEGFLPNEETYPVTVTADEEIIEITVVNDRIPEIGTTATADGEKEVHPGETITIEDVVSYQHLIPGKEYTLKGVLMDKATGEPFLVNDEQIMSKVTFVPENPSGAVVVAFTFDGAGITENTDLVVFERLYKDGIKLAVHADIEDEGQTVTVLVPEIGTTATTEDEKQTHPNETITIDDTVSYQHLIPGKEYTIKGILMDKATGEPFLVNGEQVVSEITFVPENPSGEVVVHFTFDGAGITENTDLVVFERLYKYGIKLAVHADIEDEGQTVTVLVPEIGTTATVDGEKEICATEVFTLEDVVSYENLIPGKEYTLKGVLMDKVTGKPLVINGQEIRSETSFTPNEPNGEVTVAFTFDSRYIKADTEIVVFESLSKDGMELAVHADIEDEGQTVTVLVPEIGTQASIDGKKEVTIKGEVTIEDTVSYKNLTPGKEYTIKGILMDKAAGKPFLVNGAEVRSEVTFVPEAPDGEVKVSFTFNTDGLTTATEIVVFETLYRDGVEIAIHADIEDQGQTVTMTPPAPPTPENPKTGDNSSIGFWIGLGAIALGGLASCGILMIKRKKDDENE